MLSTPLLGLIGIIGLILAYVKRGEAAGTWLQSHYRWLIRTFWFSVLWNVVGWLAAGDPDRHTDRDRIWIATTIWVLYRLIRGYVAVQGQQARTRHVTMRRQRGARPRSSWPWS